MAALRRNKKSRRRRSSDTSSRRPARARFSSASFGRRRSRTWLHSSRATVVPRSMALLCESMAESCAACSSPALAPGCCEFEALHSMTSPEKGLTARRGLAVRPRTDGLSLKNVSASTMSGSPVALVFNDTWCARPLHTGRRVVEATCASHATGSVGHLPKPLVESARSPVSLRPTSRRPLHAG